MDSVSPLQFSPFSGSNLAKGPMESAPLDLIRQAKRISLKEVWKRAFDSAIDGAVQGKTGKLYLLFPNRVVAVGPDGKTVREFRVKEPEAVGEGRDLIYITSRHDYKAGCLYQAPRVQYRLYAFQKDGSLAWQYTWPKEKYESSGQHAQPVEDKFGNVWLKINGKFYRLSRGGQKMDVVSEKYIYPHPIFAAEDGYVYTFWGEQMRYAPDLTRKTVGWHPDHFFLMGNQPYAVSVSAHKMYRVNFEDGTCQESLHWDSAKNPLKPVVAEDGTLHMVFYFIGQDVKKAFYLKLSPDGKPLRRKTLDLDLRYNTRPCVTPGGTVYMLGNKAKENGKTVHPLYALDKQDRVHEVNLPEEPIGIFSGKVEGIIAVLKSGTLLAFEAKTPGDLYTEKRREAANWATLHRLWNARGPDPLG